MKETTPPERDELKRIAEAVLFSHEGPVTAQMLVDVVPGTEKADVRSVMQELGREYLEGDRSFEILRVAGGYQICTREVWSTWVSRFQRGKRRVRLSRAAVETLGIVAFRQPVTRTEIEDIRGVDTGGVIHTLLERDLVAVKGRAKTVGRPLLYVITTEFLEYFGLDTLSDLPKLEEIEELIKESAEIMEEIETEAGPAPVVEEGGDAAEGGEDGADGEDGECETADADETGAEETTAATTEQAVEDDVPAIPELAPGAASFLVPPLPPILEEDADPGSEDVASTEPPAESNDPPEEPVSTTEEPASEPS